MIIYAPSQIRDDTAPTLVCIIGLGNPGDNYRLTRHNLGFMVLDSLAQRWQLAFVPGRGSYFLAERKGIYLLKPTTFVNQSGKAVAEFCSRFAIPSHDLLVVLDDVALPFGTIRIRKSGSSGGHNGLGSIIYAMGSEDIPRMRLGVSPEEQPEDLVSFVLSNFTPEEEKALPHFINTACDAIDTIIARGYGQAMSLFNRREIKPAREGKK